MENGRIDSGSHFIVTEVSSELTRIRAVQILNMPVIDVSKLSEPAIYVPLLLKAGPSNQALGTVLRHARPCP